MTRGINDEKSDSAVGLGNTAWLRRLAQMVHFHSSYADVLNVTEHWSIWPNFTSSTCPVQPFMIYVHATYLDPSQPQLRQSTMTYRSPFSCDLRWPFTHATYYDLSRLILVSSTLTFKTHTYHDLFLRDLLYNLSQHKLRQPTICMMTFYNLRIVSHDL